MVNVLLLDDVDSGLGLVESMFHVVHQVVFEFAIFGIQSFLPELFTNEVAETICFTAINEYCTFVEAATVGSNDDALLLSNHIFCVVVHQVANVNSSFCEEDYLTNFIHFF
mgnify:CR=1 FL=1